MEQANCPWRTDDPPRDGTHIVAVGRVTASGDDGGYSIPFTEQIYWSRRMSARWLLCRNDLSVAEYFAETVHVDYWLPLPARKGGEQ